MRDLERRPSLRHARRQPDARLARRQRTEFVVLPGLAVGAAVTASRLAALCPGWRSRRSNAGPSTHPAALSRDEITRRLATTVPALGLARSVVVAVDLAAALADDLAQRLEAVATIFVGAETARAWAVARARARLSRAASGRHAPDRAVRASARPRDPRAVATAAARTPRRRLSERGRTARDLPRMGGRPGRLCAAMWAQCASPTWQDSAPPGAATHACAIASRSPCGARRDPPRIAADRACPSGDATDNSAASGAITPTSPMAACTCGAPANRARRR